MTTKRAAELSRIPGDWVLRELPARVAVFLRAVGSHAPLQGALAAGGYSAEEHAHGQRLFSAACRYRTGGADPAEDEPARVAATELASFARTHFPRLRAALERLHPDAAPWFRGVDAADAGTAVLAVSLLLETLAVTEREAPAAPVLTTLGQRGLGSSERQRLTALVRAAERATDPAPGTTTDCADPDEAMLALHAWYADWATTARTFVKRKDWLIRMGLAKRGSGG